MSALLKFARGWFTVAFSTELERLQAKPLHYFDQQLVLYRGEDGVARILDAFCPHLGAHLGHGGTVEGNTIRCPFHAWRFDPTGHCVEIPYANKIPPKAAVKPWLVREYNGLIMVYHDPDGKAPDYEIPLIEEYGTADWLPWSSSLYRMKTQPREVIENLADKAHFATVHTTEVDEFAFETDGPIARQIMKGRAIFGEKYEKIAVTATNYGPGIQVTQMKGVFKNFLLNMTTPVDEENIDLRFAVTLKKIASDADMQGYMQSYMENIKLGYLQDQAIWENKVFRDRPVLCDGDGPMIKLRQWYRQFYTPAAELASV